MIDKLKIEDVEHEAHPHMLTAICPKCNGNAGKKPVQFYECIDSGVVEFYDSNNQLVTKVKGFFSVE